MRRLASLLCVISSKPVSSYLNKNKTMACWVRAISKVNMVAGSQALNEEAVKAADVRLAVQSAGKLAACEARASQPLCLSQTCCVLLRQP